MPASNGCRCVVVFGGRYFTVTFDSESCSFPCTPALSSNNKIFLFLRRISLFSDRSHSSKISPCIHTFELCRYVMGSLLISMWRKHRGHAALPITRGAVWCFQLHYKQKEPLCDFCLALSRTFSLWPVLHWASFDRTMPFRRH